MEQFNVRAVIAASSRARPFSTGRLPGSPRQIGQQWLFAGAAMDALHPQNSFERVFNRA